MNARNVQGVINTNGTATCMARVVGWSNEAITQADIASAAYTVYLVSATDPNVWTVVDNHDAEVLTVASIVYDTLQTATPWTVDATGYNFRHTVPIASAAFATPARSYVVQYTLTPTTGQPIVVSFALRAI
jgi:hypothetical protein